MALTDTKIKAAKPREKAYKLADERGLFLLVNPNGSKYWRFKYRFGGKEKLLAIGVYPDVSLAEAREKRDAARKMLTNEVDPSLNKQITKRAIKQATENSFQAIAVEWFTKFSPKWAPTYSCKVIGRFEKNVFPWLGTRPIHEINAPELLLVLRRIESRGAIETAHRVNQICGQVFRYAIATGRAERDVSADLRGALAPVVPKHHASIIDPLEIGKLLNAINNYQGYFATKCALQLAPLLFVRPGELRHAEWSEFNFETAEWRIPAEKMKMRKIHIVPLAKQVVSILQELYPLTGNGKYVFPSLLSNSRPMSESTVNTALRRMGYTKEEMTGHGFRSMASTLLNEQGWHFDAIERQLAHTERNSIRAAYNYAEYLPERRKMMQHWADYLEKLTRGSFIAKSVIFE
jgi:integrase